MAAVGITIAAAAPASAAWSNVGGIPSEFGVNLICKTYQTGGYGPVWKLSIVSASNPGKTISVQVWVMRGSSQVSHVAASGWNGSWGVTTTYASIILGDVYYVAAGGGELDGRGLGYGMTGPYSFSNVSYC
jgi:hypothetical protein